MHKQWLKCNRTGLFSHWCLELFALGKQQADKISKESLGGQNE
jgi:hypothetical protein